MQQEGRNAVIVFCLLSSICPLAGAKKVKKTGKPEPSANSQVAWIPVSDATGVPACVSNAPVGYADRKCVITIDRDNPVSPPTLILPGGTTVIIELLDAHWNENVQFNATTVRTAPEDLLADLLKSLVTPLESLVIQQKTSYIEMTKGRPRATPIAKEQATIEDDLQDIITSLQNATTELTCLETYKPLTTETTPYYSCIQTATLTNKTFLDAKTAAVNYVQNAGTKLLPSAEVQAADADVKAEISKCQALASGDTNRLSCLVAADHDQSVETRLDSNLAALQTAQATLLQTLQVLNAWPGTPAALAWEIRQSKSHNATITVTATEVVLKTTTPVATVTVNWQGTPFVLSTGILFSGVTYRTFSVSPLIVNGVPSVDSSGKVNTVVTESKTRPSIDFPMVMGSYTIPRFSRYHWEERCPNHCAFLATGGIGVDLTSKTAEFAVGPSFQIGGFLFTPSFVLGRETQLSNGVTVGTQLGSNPPSSLPTSNHWVKAWGIALTYAIPTP